MLDNRGLNFDVSCVWVGDNLEVMRGMNSGSVDLIYADPPFNSGKVYEAGEASFRDIWSWGDSSEEAFAEVSESNPSARAVIEASRLAGGDAMASYLVFMASRLLEMERILKESGSIWLHCDHSAGHYLKLLLDSIFGRANFRNEVIWCYRGGGVPKRAFGRKHDTLFYYSKDLKRGVFNRQYGSYSEASRALVEKRGGTSIDGRERDLARGAAMNDWWVDINALQTWSPERMGYPTQKPLALLERIISSSSHEGDLVFDPFCGSGVALLAAERLGRRWAGVDILPEVVGFIKERMSDKDIIVRKNTPTRTDIE